MPRKNGYIGFEENFPGADLTGDDLEFVRAIEAYQRRHRRRYPCWREVLHVLRSLGYRKVPEPPPDPPPPPAGPPPG